MQCTTLKSVTIPSGVTDIPALAFKYDSALKTVSIEDGVKTIGEEAFFLSGIEKITMPASIESIGKRAFYNTGSIEVIDAIEDWGFGEGFNRGNAIKYIARAGKKNPETEIEDLRKARWYINEEIKRLVMQEDKHDAE